MKKALVSLLLVLSVVLLDHASRDVFSPARAQFAGQSQWGGTSTGTNAIAVTVPNVGSLADLVGVPVWFVAGGSNTTATTLNVTSTTAKNLFRPTPSGPVAMVGGEIITNQLVGAMYDGTQYHLISKPALDMPPGAVFDYAGAAGCPVGSLVANAATPASATWPTLSAVLSTTWGSPGGGNFALPDLRGRATFSADSGGSGRITSAGGNFDGTIVGGTGGQQNQTLAMSQLPASPAPLHATLTVNSGTQNSLVVPNGSAPASPAAATGSLGIYNSGQYAIPDPITNNTANLGSGNAHPVLSNAAIVLKCVKG